MLLWKGCQSDIPTFVPNDKIHKRHPRKQTLNPKIEGLEDYVPFQIGDFPVPGWFSG